MISEASSPQPVALGVREPVPPPWSVRDSWLGVGLLLICLFASVYVMYWLGGSALARGSAVTVSELLFLIPVVAALARNRASWRDLGFRSFSGGTMALGCAVTLGIYILALFQNILLIGLHVETQGEALLQMLNTGQSPLDAALGTAIVAPFAEEIFFRGFLFQGLRQGYGWKRAAIFSSLLFAGLHLQLAAFIPTFLIGLAFAFVYNRSNSIWPGILLHFLMNSVATCLLLFTFGVSGLPSAVP